MSGMTHTVPAELASAIGRHIISRDREGEMRDFGHSRGDYGHSVPKVSMTFGTAGALLERARW
jgi:hypothetical protein